MEDDDLDELLDEIERTFCKNVSVSAASGPSNETLNSGKDSTVRKKDSLSKPKQPVGKVLEDIDALLEELLEEDSQQLKTESEGGSEEKTRSCQAAQRKCCPVFVGGSSVVSGVGTVTSKRSCDQLRCTSCDFRVLMFDDCEWDSSCDYLFLRNNTPDGHKLRARLNRRRGVRAYACQCSWFSVLEPTDLRELPQLMWVCSKHHD
ncbi:cilia- and flagella-associated protein 418 isoform X1 [Takifugu rubripes]|uniref:Cilia- and flagella-associated protein 418 n=1 Tax=Takifugu rubripes TaxID=31033 RepID=A0A674MUI6_TAKRU|nr:protein C8orf37 homolog isoform X1 [Takifugu rubripes]|eukprot:XP_011617163.1 PREDICTED: protein C8orf37 homolog isoform X1 [Takifugu rubripes]